MHPRVSRARRRLAAAALGSTVLLAGCGSSGGSASHGSGEMKIGFIAAASGAQSTFYGVLHQGVTAAVSVVNQRNLAGHKLTIVTADDGNDPRRAAQACNRLVNQEHVQAIVGFESTPSRTACNTYLAPKHIPYVAAEPSPGGYCPDNQFVDGLVPNQTFAPLLKYLKSQGTKRVYFVGNDYSSAKVTAAGLGKILPSIGASVVGASYEPFGTTDWSGDIAKLQAAKPDAIVVVLVGNDEVSFWKAVASDPRVAHLVRVDPNMTGAVAKATGPSVDGVLAVSSYFPSLSSPANSLYKETLTRKFGPKASPDQFGAQAWDAVFLLAHATKTAGSTDGQALVKALTHTSTTGPRGAVGFTPGSKGFVTATAYLGAAQADGSFKRVLTVPDIEPNVSC